MEKYQLRLDAAFHASANTTKQAVISRLAKGPSPFTGLVKPFEMELPSFMKHLWVLEEATEVLGAFASMRR